MRSLLFTLLASALACAACSSGPSGATPAPHDPSHHDAGHGHHHQNAADAKEIKPAGEAKLGDTTSCPVSGERFVVSESSPKAEHEGKTYYFCCPGCEANFKKDPQKFLNKAPSTPPPA